MACTIGAKILTTGAEFLMFKNKDLPRESFADQLIAEPDVFGVRGLHIPEGTSGEQNILSGFSIGANSAGVCACNSHVRSIKGGENYDLLTEAAVRGTRNVPEACEAVMRLARSARYNWSNILIADARQVAAVEVAEDVVHMTSQSLVARANDHLLAHACTDTVKQTPRATRALALLDAACGPEDAMRLCASHEGQADNTPICAHGAQDRRNTVYSYILHWRAGQWVLFVRQGRPCEGDYARILLRFPLDLRHVECVYPARRAAD